MFGASIASTGRATNAVEEMQLARWREVYNDKMRLVSRVLDIQSWDSAKMVLAGVLGTMDEQAEQGLSELWEAGVIQAGGGFGDNTIDPTVIELGSMDKN